MHQFDGYDENEIGDMAKTKPQIRSDYYKYRELKDAYDARLGIKKQPKGLEQIKGELKI
jgi:hypothetical protein